MKRINIFIIFTALITITFGCSKEEVDKEKDVIVTIYEHTGYGAPILSDVLTEPLLFSDSDDNEMRTLTNIITEGISVHDNYERGYRFTYKAKKVWMSNPPQDVSSIKYVFTATISKERVITKDSEEDMTLFVSSETVRYSPLYPLEYNEDGFPKIYDALFAKKEGSTNWMGIIEIEGFTYEEGYEYSLKVKEIIEADPYSKRYALIEILSKEEKE